MGLLSIPRAEVFKSFVEELSKEKGEHEEYELYASIERLAPSVIMKKRKMYKGASFLFSIYYMLSKNDVFVHSCHR